MVRGKGSMRDKKKVSKYARDNDDDDGSDEDTGGGGGSDDERTSNKKAKHSLDSDEEDNTEKYELLNRNALDGNHTFLISI